MRRFACDLEDMRRYVISMNSWMQSLEANPKESYIHEFFMKEHDNLSFREAFFLCNISMHKREMKTYGLFADEISKQWIDKATISLRLEDLHFASHHLIWQMWDAGRKGQITVKPDRMRFFAKVTGDCLEDV
jgi:hypothetical protein